jgi:drug/metabolite transporter (DMT)-like permease
MRTLAFTTFALVCFAANSLLCRLALGQDSIDAASYATVRIVSGAVVLGAMGLLTRRAERPAAGGSWPSAIALFLYAILFAFAYRTIPAGVGALILFGSVQATMIGFAVVSGERPDPLQWAGLTLALGGLAFLVRPGLAAPAPGGAAMMALAGASWGVYSLRGRKSRDPLADTSANFLRASALVASTSLVTLSGAHVSWRGTLLAILSGAVASGIGYAAWYTALPGLSATRASTVQLAVPVLAAAAAVMLLGERVTPRLLLSSAAILGGVALAVAGRRPAPS